jgi:hypothetical protein
MKQFLSAFAVLVSFTILVGCDRSDSSQGAGESTPGAAKGAHTHADGSTHEDHHEASPRAESEDHGHDEVSIGKVTIGGMEIELAQGHGKVEAGKEGHLVVKLPRNDRGATTVRAWIGTEDRTLSLVGKGEYVTSNDDYHVHAVAPNPLPENVMWWVEIEKPDGSKVVGSAKPLLE